MKKEQYLEEGDQLLCVSWYLEGTSTEDAIKYAKEVAEGPKGKYFPDIGVGWYNGRGATLIFKYRTNAEDKPNGALYWMRREVRRRFPRDDFRYYYGVVVKQVSCEPTA